MTEVTICSDFKAQESKLCHYFHCFPSIYHEMIGPEAMIIVFWMLNFKPVFFTVLFHHQQKGFDLLFAFCHKGGVICMFEIIDISPSNLDFNLCFVQPGISHDVFWVKVK